jgi:hypothetical protein
VAGLRTEPCWLPTAVFVGLNRGYRSFLPAGPLGLVMPGAGEKGEVCAAAGFFLSAFGFRISRLLL